jgi:hypothetical protein
MCVTRKATKIQERPAGVTLTEYALPSDVVAEIATMAHSMFLATLKSRIPEKLRPMLSEAYSQTEFKVWLRDPTEEEKTGLADDLDDDEEADKPASPSEA